MIHCAALQWGPPGRPLTPPLDLHLSAGSLTGIIDHNGCGKSSLLKVIAGWQTPLAGRMRVTAPRQGGIGFLIQQQAFDRQFPISLGELVASGLWRQTGSRVQRREQLKQALHTWHLSGQLQRALLARIDLEPVAGIELSFDGHIARRLTVRAIRRAMPAGGGAQTV